MEYERPAVVELGGSDAGGISVCDNGSGNEGPCWSGAAPGLECGVGSGPATG